MKSYSVKKLEVYGDYFDTNCYVIESDKKCFIVDPGYQKERIQAYVAQAGLTVEGILITHAHLDHLEALDCFDVPVYIHEIEHDVLINDDLNGFGYFRKSAPYDLSAINVIKITEDTVLPLGNEMVSVIHTPGHTIGGVCFKIGNDVCTGDTLFEGGVGKWDRPTANLPHLKQSILHLIESLPDETLIHPGHGRSSSIGREKRINSFYHEWKEECH